jgi:exodeoxyribonuclease V alpha subunit
MKLGFEKGSYVRLRSGLMYTLSELSNDGHVYAEKQQLIDKASELLEAEPATITMTMDDMLLKEELILEKNISKTDDEGNQVTPIYLPPFYYAEVGVAGKLKKLAASPAGDKLYSRLTVTKRNTLLKERLYIV